MTEADGSLYNEDFYAWTQQQAELLRRGPAAANRLDYDLIAEEIEYSGLDQPVRHWRREIAEWRLQFKKKLTRSIAAKLDLPDRHREAVGLLRYMEDEVPGLCCSAFRPSAPTRSNRSAVRTGFRRRSRRNGPRAPALRSRSRCGVPAPASVGGAAGPAGSGREIPA